jgi:hypothetical protein
VSYPAFIALAVLNVVGQAIGAIASDLYWTLRFHVEYPGGVRNARWREKVRQMTIYRTYKPLPRRLHAVWYRGKRFCP